MIEAHLDDLEACLEIVLPDSYRNTLRRLAGRKRLRNELDKRVLTTAAELRELNEDARITRDVAGLPEWPEDLFVIGDDGLGNYYAIRHDEEDSAVVIFDQEQDELREVAGSLEDFCKRIESGLPLRRKVLRRGPRLAARRAAPVVVPDFSRQPEWTRSWSSFVETYAAMPERDGRNDEEIAKVNARFGSRVVKWTGLVQRVDLGIKPIARIKMPTVAGLSAFPLLEEISFGLRWAGPTRTPGVWKPRGGSPQVLSAMSLWRTVQPGQRIEFLMMFEPGLEGVFGCVGPTRSGELRYVIGALGGHVLRVQPAGANDHEKL